MSLEEVPLDKKRQLGAELRRLRDLVGISGRELAQRIDISQSKVSRIESGHVVPTLKEVGNWADEVEASDESRQLLLELTDAAHTDARPWRQVLENTQHIQDQVQAEEQGAKAVLTFQPAVVPGLLQTAEYARRIFSMFQVPYAKKDMISALAVRMDRQLILYDEARTFQFLVTESALRWRPGPPALLVAQLDRLVSLSTLTNVSIGVLPLAAEAVVPHSHAFGIYEPQDEEQGEFVNVETIHANITLRRPADIDLYRSRWTALGKTALFGEDARRFIGNLITEIRKI